MGSIVTNGHFQVQRPWRECELQPVIEWIPTARPGVNDPTREMRDKLLEQVGLPATIEKRVVTSPGGFCAAVIDVAFREPSLDQRGWAVIQATGHLAHNLITGQTIA